MEIPTRTAVAGDIRRFYINNAVSYEQVAEHFNVEVLAVKDAIEDGRKLA